MKSELLSRLFHREDGTTSTSLIRRKSASFVDIAGREIIVPHTKHYENSYLEITKAPLQCFLVQQKTQPNITEFVVVGPPLQAQGVNELMYFAAPATPFYLSTFDLISDWEELYDGSDESNRRLKRHARMPGWKVFEQNRERILDHSRRNYDGNTFIQHDRHDVISPVIHGAKDAEGNIKLFLEPLDDKLFAQIAQKTGRKPSQLDTNLGLVLVAAVSPDNAKYPYESGYANATITTDRVETDNEKHPFRKTNEITPTQILAFIIRRIAEAQADPSSVPNDQDIQKSPLLARLVSFIETNKIPLRKLPPSWYK